jgi:Bacterial regulatory protein, Fis family
VDKFANRVSLTVCLRQHTVGIVIRFPLPPDEAAAAAYVVRLVVALTDAGGNIRAAADALGESEHTLRHRMKDLGLVAWNRKAHPLAGRQPKRVETLDTKRKGTRRG